MKVKVLAYIIRKTIEGRLELLVFEHLDDPHSGTQVPAGTVEENETLESALLREIKEESGLNQVQILFKLGLYEFKNRYTQTWHQKHIYVLKPTGYIEDTWLHIVQSGAEDHGYRFQYRWIPVETALLKYDQGDFIKHIDLEELVNCL